MLYPTKKVNYMKQKKKILYIITQGVWGGAQRYIFDLTDSMSNDFDITVAIGESKGPQDLQKQLTKQNIKIIQLKHLVRRISLSHDILAIFELIKLYKKVKPDIIHLNSSKAGFIGSLTKLLTHKNQISIVYTAHGWVFLEPLSKLKKQLYLWAEKYTTKYKNAIVVLSQQDKDIAIKKIHPNKTQVHIIPIGITSIKQQQTKKQALQLLQTYTKKSLKTHTLIGVVANFYKTKGIDIFLQAIAIIKNKLDNTQIIIIGDGPERKNLEQLIDSLKLNHIITLAGYIPNAKNIIPAFDLIVSPSKKEGLPYAILETMQAGIPIIATKVGGIPSVIKHEKNGVLIEPNDPDMLAQAIKKYLQNKKAFATYAANAKKDILKYSDKNMIKETTALYQSLL
jgi:glycosyltransferase involved in cell wall biosynthesis